MKNVSFLAASLTFSLFLTACGDAGSKTEPEAAKTETVRLYESAVDYSADTTKLIGFVAYNEASTEKRPAVLIVPEWWGLNEYPKTRARQLASLGYVALVADFYGNGLVVDSPSQAGNQASKFYTNPALINARFTAALNKLKSYPQVDTTKLAAIGYCFGGSMVLNAAKMGAPVSGVVSFHGDLRGVRADKSLLKAKILVCHGAADSFVPQEQVDAFKKQMDSIGASYTFEAYPDAVHAFTNPESTLTGQRFGMNIKYNAAADSASWKDMQDFFGNIFK